VNARLASHPLLPYTAAAMLQRLRPSGFIEPCLPSPADQPPTGSGWVHEIKHDGFRLMARHAMGVARELTFNSGGFLQQDWSAWTMTVHDDVRTELFSLVISDFKDGGSGK
jgi:hypothetical protein